MSDKKEMMEDMAGLLRAESGFRESFDEEEEADIALVEERLFSFYSKQLEHPPPKRRSTIKKTAPLPIHKLHAYPCRDTHSRLPSLPQKWPQRPVSMFVFRITMCGSL